MASQTAQATCRAAAEKPCRRSHLHGQLLPLRDGDFSALATAMQWHASCSLEPIRCQGMPVTVLLTPRFVRSQAVLGSGLSYLLLAAMQVTAATPSQWQSPETIRQAAEQFAAAQFAAQSQVLVEAVSIDDRLKLPRCAKPLQTTSQRSFDHGSGTVVVSCPSAWRLFVPVRISVQAEAVVLRHAVQRGAVLAAADLEVTVRRSSSLPRDYVARVEDAVGLKLRRSIGPGSVLVPAALEQPRFVTRGGLVSLVTRRGGIAVKSQGIALQNAGLSQRVRVQTQSGRIVEGTVESDHLVRVGP